MDREKFIEQIKIAFADVQYPGDDHLIVDTNHWECLEMAQSFKGKHWSEITEELALNSQLRFPCFTPEAFQFFLPGLLIARFIYPETTELETFLTYMLIPVRGSEEEVKSLSERVKNFNVEQKNLIRAYIEDFLKIIPLRTKGRVKGRENSGKYRPETKT